jgi:hypothetical protein
VAVGVGHPIQPLPDVRRADAASRGIERPAGVVRTFQVSEYTVEPSETVAARYLLAKHDVRSALADEPEELGPQVARVICPTSTAGDREGLAGAGAGPDFALVGPPGGSQGVGPYRDSRE